MGRFCVDDLARNAAHDVDAELEALGVNPVGEWLESGIVGGGGESGRIGDEDAVFVPEIFARFERCRRRGPACTSLRR